MPSVADALSAFAPAFYQRYGGHVPLESRKVLDAIIRCRTGQLGGVLYQCQSCQRQHWTGRSCGNRHCPNCQFEKTQAWLAKQTANLLPVHHFCVTFTVPAELRMTLRSAKRDGYEALFNAAADSLRDVGSAMRSLKDCQLGFFGVLHTWGRDPLVYHPHVHFVVPGGGVLVDEAGDPLEWRSTAEDFLVCHKTLIRVYKAKLTDQLRACGLYEDIPESAWKKKSVVDIKPVGDGRAVLKYLAPYVHRVAICNKRIVSVDETHVTYTARPSGSSHTVTRRVEGLRFVGGFLQHVLPRRFKKVRYYGWLSANSRIDIEEVRWLVCLFLGVTFLLATGGRQAETSPPDRSHCRHCGGKMEVVLIVDARCRLLVEYALKYQDSG